MSVFTRVDSSSTGQFLERLATFKKETPLTHILSDVSLAALKDYNDAQVGFSKRVCYEAAPWVAGGVSLAAVSAGIFYAGATVAADPIAAMSALYNVATGVGSVASSMLLNAPAWVSVPGTIVTAYTASKTFTKENMTKATHALSFGVAFKAALGWANRSEAKLNDKQRIAKELIATDITDACRDVAQQVRLLTDVISVKELNSVKGLRKNVALVKEKMEKELPLIPSQVGAALNPLNKAIDDVMAKHFALKINKPRFNAKLLANSTEEECMEIAVPRDVERHVRTMKEQTLGMAHIVKGAFASIGAGFAGSAVAYVSTEIARGLVSGTSTYFQEHLAPVAAALASVGAVYMMFNKYKKEHVESNKIAQEHKERALLKMQTIYSQIGDRLNAKPNYQEAINKVLPSINKAIAATGLETKPGEITALLNLPKMNVVAKKIEGFGNKSFLPFVNQVNSPTEKTAAEAA